MKTTLKVGGMTCPHCAMRLKNALMDIKDVIDAQVNLMEKNAVIISKEPIAESVISLAVEEAGYKFEGIVG